MLGREIRVKRVWNPRQLRRLRVPCRPHALGSYPPLARRPLTSPRLLPFANVRWCACGIFWRRDCYHTTTGEGGSLQRNWHTYRKEYAEGISQNMLATPRGPAYRVFKILMRKAQLGRPKALPY